MIAAARMAFQLILDWRHTAEAAGDPKFR